MTGRFLSCARHGHFVCMCTSREPSQTLAYFLLHLNDSSTSKMFEEAFLTACGPNLDAKKADEWLDRIRGLYSESGRYYHCMEHVEALLALAKEYDLADDAAVVLAIVFHDVIYDAKSQTSEDQSAEIFLEFAENDLNATPELMSTVNCYILQTKHHMQCPPDAERNLKLFLDFDLEILGADEERYDRYATNVRKEYAHIPEEDFRKGRAHVLESFLKNDYLYFSPEFRQRCELKARQNIARELKALI